MRQGRTRASLMWTAAAVLGCVATLATCSRKPSATDDSNVIAVTVQPARVGTLRDTISVTGTVTPLASADFVVVAPVPCNLAEVTKNEGDQVHAGDVLVRLDIAAVAAEVAARQLELTDAMAKASQAKADADRLGDLFQKGLAARVLWQNATAAQSTADTNLVQVRARVDAAKALQEGTIIRARFNGVVSKRWHVAGDAVAGGDADPILRVVDPTRLQVSAQVSVQDSTRILVGQAASVITPNGSEPAIVALRMTPSSTAAQTMDVRLNFQAPTTLPIDTAVQVDIVVDERKDVLVIPADAIQRGDDGTFVWVASANNQATRRDVRIGLISHNLVQIVSGLALNDQVIVTGIADMAEGVPITISK